MDFPTLLVALFSALKIPPLEEDGSGYCTFEVDGMPLTLHAPPEADTVAMLAPVGIADPEDYVRLEELLVANLGFKDEVRLAVDDNSNIVLMHWLPLAEIDFPGFMIALEDFLNYAEFWIDRFNQPRVVAAPLPAAATSALA